MLNCKKILNYLIVEITNTNILWLDESEHTAFIYYQTMKLKLVAYNKKV